MMRLTALWMARTDVLRFEKSMEYRRCFTDFCCARLVKITYSHRLTKQYLAKAVRNPYHDPRLTAAIL